MSVMISLRLTNQLANAVDDVVLTAGANRNETACAALRHFSLLSEEKQKKLIKQERQATALEKVEEKCQ